MQLSFLPPMPLAPTMPTAPLERRALDFLLAGQAITTPEFQAVTGTWRLSAMVKRLANLGWPIRAAYEAITATDGHRQDIARYSLSPETLEQLRQAIGTCPHCAHKGAGSDFFALSHATSQPSQTTAPEAPQ
jgi:hypothetical protein